MIANPFLFIRWIQQFNSPTTRIAGWPDEQRSRAAIIFSAGVHLLVVVLVLISPFIGSHTPILPEIYQVELVNVTDYQTRTQTTTVAAKPVKVKVTTRPRTVVISHKAVSLNPIRNRLLNESRNLEEADQRQLAARLARIQIDAEAEEMRQKARDEAARAVKNLARILDGQEQSTKDQKITEPPTGDSDRGEKTRPSSTADPGNDHGVINVLSAGYLARLGALIQRHWVLPDLQKKWPQDMQARIKITLTPDGRIKALAFLKRARDFRFNVQAEKALRKSAPFPPPPPEIAAEAGQIVLTFTPEEVR